MIIEAYHSPDNSFHWLDVVDPTGSELESIALQYGLPSHWIKDCLDPKHLPKYEKLHHHDFIMLRSRDEMASSTANTLRELTQKIAIFFGENYIITVHRRDRAYLTQIREKWVKTTELDHDPIPQLLAKIILGVISTYNTAFNQAENKLEDFEQQLFNEESTSLSIQEKFILKSQAYVFKRVLRMSLDIQPKLKVIIDYNPSLSEDIKEAMDAAFFEAEHILEHVNNLINLHLSLASHRTNRIIRILTILSVYFMPLTFLVGIYGMNFHYMPELRFPYSYPILLSTMILICLILYFWFKQKKWLQ